MNIDSMVESWGNMLHDDFYRDEEYLKCDYCDEEKHEDSEDWQQSALDKSLSFCCSDCKEEFEQEFTNEMDELENTTASTLFLSLTVSELRQKLGHEKCRGTFNHSNTQSVIQDWKGRQTIVIFNDMSKLHFGMDEVSYST